MFSTFEIVKDLCEKQGISLNTLEEKLELGKNSLYGLKRNQPSAERLQQIADYFNVSTDYLLGRTDNPNIAGDSHVNEPDDIDKIIDHAMLFDGKPLTDEDRRAIRGIISGYMNSKGD
jgi:XRE family transcriptional regulator|uniref:Repressor protein n=2 Tax=unclassified Caudoviricetes TaxID=2788787 RepID=A0A8S5QK24_9CAUD|nr:MAG TPA: repressor protein [Siphoviridae sp. ctL053]DAE18900.1 MAG TPA: repressor protein [Siphoviridae sp. ctNPp8]